MPRNKRGGARGRGKFSSPRGGRGTPTPGTSFIPFAGAYVPQRPQTGFTLQEEARNTERHHSFWNSDQRLRDTKVSFVSAGEFNPPDLIKDSEEALAGMSLESTEPPTENLNQDVKMASHEANMAAPSSLFMLDTDGGNRVETGLAPPRLRSISPARSDSSEEVILFHGRGQVRIEHDRIEHDRTEHDPQTSADTIDARIKFLDDKLLEQEKLLEEALDEKEASLESIPPELAQALNKEMFLGAIPHKVTNSPSPDFEAILPKRQNKNRGQGRIRRGRKAASRIDDSDEEDAMIADYIANMDQEHTMSDVDQTFNKRELGADDDAAWEDDSSVKDTPEFNGRHGWGRTELQDFDDLSTSDEARGKVETILSKRHRVGGVQYLVIWEHQDVDEARWVPLDVLQDSGALPLIEVFEAEEKLVAEFESNGDEDSDDSDDFVDGDDDDHDDEQDLVQRRIAKMNDEQIARLISKQEELGMGGDEILLFDDEVDDEDEDMEASTIDLSNFILSGRRGRKERQRRQGEFPSAAPLADAYDGFDVMDFDRPSLKKKPKGRKGKLILDDISDSELEASMQSAWVNDRVKKKERKQEREVLRARGLLTGKNGKPDMKARYKEGMGIEDVKEEIKEFLKGDNTTLSLPAMDKADRKFVHEIANAFKLKSKSAGLGNKRYPILYRTSRTTVYGERAYEAAASKLSRRFLPRNDVGGRRAGAAPKRGARGGGGGFGGGFGAASYRDGDVVGASAPELGVENKGRAMLEKMGWSAGTALGALDNKGILQPVSHVVKTTKAGLG